MNKAAFHPNRPWRVAIRGPDRFSPIFQVVMACAAEIARAAVGFVASPPWNYFNQ
jgi:hypothetical protein